MITIHANEARRMTAERIFAQGPMGKYHEYVWGMIKGAIEGGRSTVCIMLPAEAMPKNVGKQADGLTADNMMSSLIAYLPAYGYIIEGIHWKSYSWAEVRGYSDVKIGVTVSWTGGPVAQHLPGTEQ